MNFIFLLILTSCTQIKSEDDQKYIDLLPESEKQAFLDIVARRLFKEVDSKVTNAKSGEISDKQLEEHGDFVRRILAEESSNLRRNKDDDDKEIGVIRTIKKGDIKAEEEASDHIDLTLRNGKRLKRSNSLEKTSVNQSHKDDEIPVQVIYDKSDVSTMKTMSGEASDDTDIQVKGSRRTSDDVKGDLRSHTVITNYEPDDTEEIEKSKDNSNSKEVPKRGSHSNGVTASIYEEQQYGEVLSDIDENQTTNAPLLTSSVTVTTVPTKLDTITTKATTITTTIQLETENIQNKTENNTETIQPRYLRSADKIAEIDDTEKSYNITNSPKVKENNTDYSSENATTIPIVTEIPLITTILPLITDKAMGRSKIVETQDNNKLAIETKSTDKPKTTTEVVIDSITTAKLPITVHPDLAKMASTVYKAVDNLTTLNKSEINTNATKEVKIFKNLVKALRNGLQFQFEEYEEDENENQKSKQSLLDLKPLTTKKPYEVYEIPADIAPFVKKSKSISYKEKRKSVGKKQSKNDESTHKQKTLNEEQPYYVPVYNYSPEQVYFNSYNRLGPNYDQTDDIDDKENINDFSEKTNDKAIKRQGKTDGILRKFKFNRKPERTEKKKRYSSRILKNNRAKLKMPLVIKSPKFTEIYFNPDDYLDMDYYFGRRQETKIPKKTQSFLCKTCPHNHYFPDTDDEEHVINAMKSGKAKSFRNAVRQIMYARNIFGHISDFKDRTTTEPPESKEFILRSRYPAKDSEVIQNVNRYSAPEENDEISIDYYFGFEDKSKMLNGIFKKRANRDCDMCKMRIYKFDGKSKKRVSSKEAVNEVDEEEEEPTNKKTGTIKEILSLYPTDAFIHLDELLKYNVPITRTTARDKEVKPFVTVLKDMIESGNDALVKYDWLGTTVDIQSALDKLTDLSEVLLDGDNIPQSDLQLFKYFQYLYVTSKATLDESNPLRNDMVKEDRKILLPKNKNRKPAYLKDKGLLHRAWLFRGRYEQLHSKKSMSELQMFLLKLNKGLYDLHTALKSIAIITTYENQRWFQNLKDLYLKDAKDKQILEVLLHLSLSRVFGLLEESAKDGWKKAILCIYKNMKRRC